jgi:serine protease AprX
MVLVGFVKTLRRGSLAAFLTLSIVFTLAMPAGAAGRRARLSTDLADHLAVGSPSIDVIVHGTRAEVDALARKYNVRVRRHLRSGAVLRVTAGQLAALQEDESQEHLSADVPIRSVADVTAQSIGADQVWAGSDGLPPLSGAGVTVAVIDSGVDPRHAALRNRVIHTEDFTGGDGIDRYGHGTHVAALIAGRPGQTPETADYRGIASGSRIVNLRVLGDDGSGMSSNVIEALDWAVENRKRFDIRVINLSLGAPVTQPYRDDPMCEAVERAVAAGMIVVVAAGNYGVDAEGRTVYGSIASPGNDPNVITVGAVDTHGTAQRSDDTVARFSSRGPTRFDLVLKPDLVAPGSGVVSAEASDSYLARTYSQRHVTGTGTNSYIQLSGTSMSAGVVSGTVAFLLEGRSRLTTRDAKAVLQLSSSFMRTEGLTVAGAGSLNALAARQLISSRNIAKLRITTITNEETLSAGIAFANREISQGSKTFDATEITLAGIGPGGPIEKAARGRLASRDGSRTDRRLNPVFNGARDTIYWGVSDTIYWGASDTIYWGASDTIYWGASDTIYWGASDTSYWRARDTVYRDDGLKSND